MAMASAMRRVELPPRARRIQVSHSEYSNAVGTTSACAENTIDAEIMPACSGNYLRVRGEYRELARFHMLHMELPPRARRILAVLQPYAGGRNYLRVRGEYICWYPHAGLPWELPPRARRIHVRVRIRVDNEGTTSACAENTTQPVNHEPPRWNYLRVRGEYRPKRFGRGRALELPPRARRILIVVGE